jgi:GTP cyclohydrolase II
VSAAPRKPLHIEAEAPLPTKRGSFRVLVFRHADEPTLEHVALVRGELRGAERALVRVHSECMTSEVFGSLKCDCALQLDAALERIDDEDLGALVYLRQEGRGIGLANKIRAYALQAEGLDTVDANRALGLPDDCRRYDAAAALLHTLGVRSIRLITNNPEKITALCELGVEVASVVPSVVPTNPHSAGYLATKRVRMHHLML